MKLSVKIFSFGTITLCAGALAGLGLAQLANGEITPPGGAEALSDPKERYNLGQNAFRPPKVKARRSVSLIDENTNYQVGKTRDGKRLLVPSEPALKSERDALEAREAAQEAYFGQGGTNQAEAVADYQDSLNRAY